MAEFPASDKLIWNEGEVAALLKGQQGPVARDMLRRGLRVEASAKNFATGIGGGPHVRTGRLRSSISTAIGEDSESVYADVGTNVEYAGFVELGTRRAKAYPYLRPALIAAI